MDWHHWVDEDQLPSPTQFDNSYSFSEAISESILERHSWEHGGTPDELSINTVRSFADLYAHVTWYGKLVITPDNAESAVESTLEDPTEHTISVIGNRIFEQFSQLGWIYVDASYCFDESEWAEVDQLFVRPVSTDHQTILEYAENDLILSTDQLRDYFREELNSQFEDKEINHSILSAYIAAIETNLENKDWIAIKALETPVRLWIDKSKAISEILDEFEEEETIPHEKLQKQVFRFIREFAPRINSNTQFDIEPFVESFYQSLREKGWRSIDRGDKKTFYRSIDCLKADLEEDLETAAEERDEKKTALEEATQLTEAERTVARLEENYETRMDIEGVIVSNVSYPVDNEQEAAIDWVQDRFGEHVPVWGVRNRAAIKRAIKNEGSIFTPDAEETDMTDVYAEIAEEVSR
jgi:hypothetical protein